MLHLSGEAHIQPLDLDRSWAEYSLFSWFCCSAESELIFFWGLREKKFFVQISVFKNSALFYSIWQPALKLTLWYSLILGLFPCAYTGFTLTWKMHDGPLRLPSACRAPLLDPLRLLGIYLPPSHTCCILSTVTLCVRPCLAVPHVTCAIRNARSLPYTVLHVKTIRDPSSKTCSGEFSTCTGL